MSGGKEESEQLLHEQEVRERKLCVTRFLHTQEDIIKLYGNPEEPLTIKDRVKAACSYDRQQCLHKLLSFLPIVGVLRDYKWREYIIGDILSGVSAACLHFPQGLAFGLLASLTPAYGLYVGFFPVLFYMIFGTSPHVSFGTNAVIALFTAEMVEGRIQGMTFSATPTAASLFNQSVALNGTETFMQVTSAADEMLAFKVMTASGASLICGLVLVTMGMLRLGLITTYMSSSFIHAFVSVCAFHIATSQVPKALGIKIPLITGAGKLILTYIEIFKAIPTANVASIIITIVVLIVLILVKDCINKRFKDKMKMPVPIDLIVIIIATPISHFGKFNENFGVPTVGKIPSGFPMPRVPSLSSEILGTCLIVAVLIFVLTIAMARTCEERHNYQVDDNQELVAYGMSNLLSSFFHCFPSCTAPPRTMILSAMGAKTTLNGLYSAIIMCLIIMVIGPLFTSLPHPVLSAMVIVAVKDLLLHVIEVPSFWRINRYDAVIWIGTMLSGILIDVPYALYTGVILGLFTVIVQSQNAPKYVMAAPPNEDVLIDKESYHSLQEYPGIKIFRMESSLYFATAMSFRGLVFSELGDPRKVNGGEKEQTVNVNDVEMNGNSQETKTKSEKQFIILECSSVNYVDMNGMKVIAQLVNLYKNIEIPVLFARCSKQMQNCFKTSILEEVVTASNVYVDIQDAVHACMNQQLP